MSIASIHETPILFYEGPHYYLSNFSSFAVMFNGQIWMTAEHLYQAHKFFWQRDGNIVDEIFHALSAHEAKQLGKVHKNKVVSDWDRMKLSAMEDILRAKYAQHPYVQIKLLQTGNAKLIEDSPKDSFWGRGPDLMGLNYLGRIWMKIRAEEQARVAAIDATDV